MIIYHLWPFLSPWIWIQKTPESGSGSLTLFLAEYTPQNSQKLKNLSQHGSYQSFDHKYQKLKHNILFVLIKAGNEKITSFIRCVKWIRLIISIWIIFFKSNFLKKVVKNVFSLLTQIKRLLWKQVVWIFPFRSMNRWLKKMSISKIDIF